MKIELTSQQEQAVQQGRPVEIIDPASCRTFVVMARELYERIRPLPEASCEPAPCPPAAPPGAPPAQTPEGAKVPRVRLRDLPTPPDVAAEVKRLAKEQGLWWKSSRQRLEDQLKLQFYYGGQCVYVLRKPDGPVVVAIEERFRDTPDLRYILFTPEERSQACLSFPSRWRDTNSELLTLFHHED